MLRPTQAAPAAAEEVTERRHRERRVVTMIHVAALALFDVVFRRRRARRWCDR